ncbi:MAG: hypothetical protein H7X92_13095 [Chitinophagales bacterium]|nr:hypothetical protein [Hyphomicrobiales bacterium]
MSRAVRKGNLKADFKHTRKNEIRNYRQQQASAQNPLCAITLVTLTGLFWSPGYIVVGVFIAVRHLFPNQFSARKL